MTAPNKMAKRAAAGTLALAVCLGGGLLGSGAAHAAVTGQATAAVATTVATIDAGDNETAAASVTYSLKDVATNGVTATNQVTFTLSLPAGVTLGSGTITAANGMTAYPVGGLTATGFTVALPDSTTFDDEDALTISGITLDGSAYQSAGAVVLDAGSFTPSTTIANSTAGAPTPPPPPPPFVGDDRVVTPSSGANGKRALQFTKTTAQALDDLSINIPVGSSWSLGDRVLFSLPEGLTFNGVPTITASKVSGNGTALPTLSAGVATQTTAGAGLVTAPANRQIAFNFTNTEGTTSADASTDYKLVISGIKVDVNSSYAGGSITVGDGADQARVLYQAQTQSSPQAFGPASDLNDPDTIDVLGYFRTASIDISAGGVYVVDAEEQSAPNVTITESAATSIATGARQVVLRFVDAKGKTVDLDDVEGAGFAPTLKVNGQDVTDVDFSYEADDEDEAYGQLTFSATFTGAIDTLVIGNLRFEGDDSHTGPIRAELLAPVVGGVGVDGAEAPGFTSLSTGTVSVTQETNRLGGATRFDTASQIVSETFGDDGNNYSNFVLANGDGTGIDALSGNYAAGIDEVPLLLTEKNSIPSSTLALMRKLANFSGVVTVEVIGGEAAVSAAAIAELKAAFPDGYGDGDGFRLVIERSAGDDRYDTAARVATNKGVDEVETYTPTYGTPERRTAILARGDDPADAVVVGGISYRENFPLLLSAPGSVPKVTLDALDTLNIQHVVIAGGDSAISPAAEAQLKAAGVTTQRLAGGDRFETAAKVADWARTPSSSPSQKENAGLGYNVDEVNDGEVEYFSTDALVGNGYRYADILAAGQLSALGSEGEYIPVITSDGAKLSAAASTWLSKNKDDISEVVGLGGGVVLPTSTLDEAVKAAE